MPKMGYTKLYYKFGWNGWCRCRCWFGFDKLVSEEKNGLVIHDENTPKIIKKTDRNL